MPSNNEFRFIGTVYGNPDLEQFDEKNYRVWFTLAIKSSIGKKTNYVRLLAPSNLWEKTYYFCRNGNTIAVYGEVVSKEITDKRTGNITTSLTFVVSDVFLIRKCSRTNVSTKKFEAIVNSMPLELNIGGETDVRSNDNELLLDESGQGDDFTPVEGTQD